MIINVSQYVDKTKINRLNNKLDSLELLTNNNINYLNILNNINYLIKKNKYDSISNHNVLNELIDKLLNKINEECINLIYIINKDNLDYINRYKKKISNNFYIWNKYKLLSNEYELVYNSKYSNSIAKKKPLSRSYFKMIEINNIFFILLIGYQKELTTLHLAEGPGGFIEALIDQRKKYCNNKKDVYYAISLETQDTIPGWDKSIKFLKENKNVKIMTGIKNNGNIIDIDNIKYISERLKLNKVDLITADGGFNFDNQITQEYSTSLLIFSELLIALGSLKINGCYVYKIYDMNYKITLDILYLTILYFDDVFIFKPLTSRSGNSEKYIICKNFNGISNDDYNKLINLFNDWINIKNTNENIIKNYIYIKLFFERRNLNLQDLKIIDNILINGSNDLNLFYLNLSKVNQIFNVKQANKIEDTFNFEQFSKSEIDSIYEKQVEYAKSWCFNNNVEYNN